MAELNKLLGDVKTTVEGLLSVPTANVWSIYGGLKRLSSCIENILNHGLKYSLTASNHSSLDYNQFIRSLQWLNPVLAPSADKLRKLSQEENISEGQAWVRHSLRVYTMLAQLKALVGDRQNLSTFYYDNAFLCNPDYFEALCVCLDAVEKNRPSLLANINHTLLGTSGKTRSSTLPLGTRTKDHRANIQHQLSVTTSPSNTQDRHMYIAPQPSSDPLTNKPTSFTRPLLRTRNSQTKLDSPSEEKVTMRSPTTANPALDSILNNEDSEENKGKRLSRQNSSKVSKGKQPMKGHQRSKSDLSFLKGQKQRETKSASSKDVVDSVVSTSLPDHDSELEQRVRNASVLTNANSAWLQTSGHYFPRPSPGESLKSYLSSQDFDTCAELDRENAHFAISEALIAAIEHMKWNQVLRPADPIRQQPGQDESEVESDEEIVRLKKRIQERRRIRNTKKLPLSTPSDKSLMAPASERSSGGATPKSSSRSNSLRDSDSMYSEEDSYGGSAFSDTDSLLTLRDGVTLFDSLSEGAQPGPNVAPSADQVALSLLSQFNEYHLPKADQLVWLVSEKEAPQALLPLPDSVPISPDDMMEGRKGTRIRGNSEWAPPRSQIIFNIHPPPRRKVLISKQNYRCAGCGMKIEQGYLKRFRYCEYLGKYFCHCCHTNKTSVIPARILHKWDFSKFPVSNFSHDLIERMVDDPLFNVLDIDRHLLEKVQTLQRITLSRLQLRFSMPFLASCRLGTQFYEALLAIPTYLIDDVHIYSINDLLKAKSKELDKSLQASAKHMVGHILTCTLCKAKGFICEICDNEKDIIFPFQFEKVIRCNHCLSCFHLSCYGRRGKVCPKCARVESRRQSMETQAASVKADSPQDYQ